MTILEVVLRYWSSKYIKILSSGCKVPLWCVLTEKRQLKWIGTSRIFSPFGGRLSGGGRPATCSWLYRSMRLEDLKSVEERTQKCDRGKPRVAMTSDQTSLYVVLSLDSYASPLHWLFKSFGLLIVPLSEVKSYVVVLFFYINRLKGRTLQACSLKYSIKKGMFFCLGQNWNYFSRAEREYSPLPLLPPPFPCLRA